MVYPHVQDEFDEAMSTPTRAFHGQVAIEAYKVAWKKGDFGAHTAYDPEAHRGEDWLTTMMIKFIVTPLDPTKKLITPRDMPRFAPEWTMAVLPSIQALAAKIAAIKGTDVKAINPLRELNKLWVAGEFIPRPDNKPSETWTTIKFIDVWATREECEAHAASTKVPDAENGTVPVQAAPTPDAQRATYAQFLPAMWTQAGKDRTKMEELLKANPLLVGFTMDSPEVQAVMA